MPVSGGLARPLAFALVTHWLGSALSFLWRLGAARSVWEYFQEEVPLPSYVKEKFVGWFFGVGSIIIDPFLTLISIFFTSFFCLSGC